MFEKSALHFNTGAEPWILQNETPSLGIAVDTTGDGATISVAICVASRDQLIAHAHHIIAPTARDIHRIIDGVYNHLTGAFGDDLVVGVFANTKDPVVNRALEVYTDWVINWGDQLEDGTHALDALLKLAESWIQTMECPHAPDSVINELTLLDSPGTAVWGDASEYKFGSNQPLDYRDMPECGGMFINAIALLMTFYSDLDGPLDEPLGGTDPEDDIWETHMNDASLYGYGGGIFDHV